MDTSVPDKGPARTLVAPVGRGLIRFVCNSNPFYAISAVLVLLGLRASYDPDAAAFPTWALLSGLAAYTLLLAGMACVLVRRGGVWDDIRTLILLVAMVLLAIPAFFDDILARNATLGIACETMGLLFAIAVSEGLLRGLTLRLPAGFRVPYYLTLTLFFLHPVALVPLLRRPGDPALMWALLAFPALAGLVSLTLIPAARRGPTYVAKSGSPWRWPMYPWSLFVLICTAVCARSFSLCLAINYSDGTAGHQAIDATIFGPYFLVPFGLGVAAVILECGLAARSRPVIRFALLLPLALVFLAAVGHRPDAAYGRFLQLFADRLGGSPMYAALLAATGFYVIAAARRVPGAIDALTIAVAAMCRVGPETLDLDGLSSPRALPLALAAVMQAGLALTRRSTTRASLASAALVGAIGIGPIGTWGVMARAIVAVHVAVGSAMLIGALGRDALARFLRGASAVALALATTAPLWDLQGLRIDDSLRFYPILPVIVAAAYGHLIGSKLFYLSAMAGLTCWVALSGGRAYAALRRSIVGLDQIVLGLLFFALAAMISLMKGGARPGRALARKLRNLFAPRPSGPAIGPLEMIRSPTPD